MLIILVTILNLILQSTVLPYFPIMGIVPNTSLVLLVVVSLAKGKVYGGIYGLIIGMLQDIMFSVTLGINSLIYFFIGYFIGFIEDTFVRDNIINPIIFTASGTIFYNIVYSVFLYFLTIKITFAEVISAAFSIEIIYNCIISVIVYKLFQRFILESKIRFNKK